MVLAIYLHDLAIDISSGDTEYMSSLHQVFVHHWILQSRDDFSHSLLERLTLTVLAFEFERSDGNLSLIKTKKIS